MNKKQTDKLKDNEFIIKFLKSVNSLPSNEKEDLLSFIKDSFAKNVKKSN